MLHRFLPALLLALLSLNAGAAVVGNPTPWPHAAIPCSTGDAYFGPGQQFDPTWSTNTFLTLKAAVVFALANPGSDGLATVRFTPGTYLFQKAQSEAWGGPSAKWSKSLELCGDAGIARLLMPDGSFRFTINQLLGARLQNVWFDGIWAGVQPSRDWMEWKNMRMSNTSNEVVAWAAGPDMTNAPTNIDPITSSYFLLYQSKLDDDGYADGDGHAMYLTRRGCLFFAIENDMDSQTTLETWRSLCRFGYWANNNISNTGRDPLRPGQGGAIDTPSCGTNVFKRNKIIAEGKHCAICVRARRSITGCDMPNQQETSANDGIAGTPPFLVRDPAFWDSVRAMPIPLNNSDPAALLTNPQLFPVILWDNQIIGIGNDGPAIILYSSFAMHKVADSSEYLRMPYNWTERVWALMVGQKPVGFKRIWESTRNTAIHPSTLPDVKLYVTQVLDVTEKVKFFEIAAPPSEWMPDTNDPRAICEYFRARSNWLDEPSVTGHQGFPACDNVPHLTTIPPPSDSVLRPPTLSLGQ